MADNFDLRKFLSENKLTKNAQLLTEADETQEAYALVIDEDGNFTKEDLTSYAEESYLDPEGEKLQGAQEVLDYPNSVAAWQHAPEQEQSQNEEWKAAVAQLGDSYDYYDVIADGGENAVIAAIPQGSSLMDYLQDEDDDMYEGSRSMRDKMNEGSFMDAYKTKAAKDAYYIARKAVVDNLESTTYEDLPEIVADAVNQAEQETKQQVSELEKRALLKHINWVLTHNQQMEFESKQTKKPVMESKLSSREKYLTRLVENALGLEGYGDDNVNKQREKQGLPPAQGPKYSEGVSGDEMVEEKPLPKYENIEKLMQEIDKSTDEEAHKFKMQEMKRVADMLEKKCTALEEGEDADHIDQKKLKQMKKDIMSLRKNIEKMEKLGEKKFAKKETKADLKEGFDLRNFLVENKLTYNSRITEQSAE